MKISKLLLLGMLIVALSMPAFASRIELAKEIYPGDPGAYNVGDVIHFIVIVGNPVENAETNTITGIIDTLPGGATLYLLEPGVDPVLVQDPGDSLTYDVYYTVEAGHIISLPGSGHPGVLNYVHVDGYDSEDDIIDASTSKSAKVYTPHIVLNKYADMDAFCEGTETEVTYTFELTNDGDEDITDPWVWDDKCGMLAQNPGDYTGDDGDGYLNPGETWTVTCVQILTETTYNVGSADGFGRYTGTYVTAEDDETVTASAPPSVSVDPADATICEVSEQEFCAVAEGGTPPYSYEWTKVGDPTVISTDECIIVSEPGEYCVEVTDEAGCTASACALLSIIEQPDCSIDSGPTSLCDDQIDIPQEYCTVAVADHYEWEVMSGPGVIDGPIDGMCVDVVPTDLGTIVLELRLWNDVPGDGSCGNSCQIQILVEECGGGFCTFTQGFYGNEGGMACDDMTTTEIINEVIGDGVVVGILGQRSITFSTAADIILRLPCGGKPKVLPEVNVNANDQAALEAAKLVKKKGDVINNVLVGQMVALTLNMRLHTIPCLDEDGFDQGLGDYTFPEADYICVQKGEEGCIMRYEIPESLQGLSVAALLEAGNMALAGDEELVAGAYEGASFVNELFDECLTIVTCPVDPVEICDDGCDNDFDGLTDMDDPDCWPS